MGYIEIDLERILWGHHGGDARSGSIASQTVLSNKLPAYLSLATLPQLILIFTYTRHSRNMDGLAGLGLTKMQRPELARCPQKGDCLLT